MSDYRLIVFSEWKKWCLENKRIPQKKADGYEGKLNSKISYCMQYMKSYHEKYEKQIEEYYELLNIYGKFKSRKARINEWLSWIEKHNRLPRRKSQDIEEARLANNISQIYNKMKKEPEINKELLDIYYTTCSKYLTIACNRNDVLGNFEVWKDWVKLNKRLPRYNIFDTSESFIANRMVYVLHIMRDDEKLYEKELKEYNDLYFSYSQQKVIDKYKEKFTRYKVWVETHERLPSFNGEEKNYAEKMSRVIRIMRKNEEMYKEQLDDLEILHSKYANSENKTIKKALSDWNIWCNIHEKLPKYNTGNDYENKLAHRIARAVKLMKKSPDLYTEELKTYYNITEKYGKSYQYIKVFLEWKSWVMKNKRVPLKTSSDCMEKKLATKINTSLINFRSSPDVYRNYIKEYNFIQKEFCLKNAIFKQITSAFDAWKEWCILHNRIPRNNINDTAETKIYTKMTSWSSHMKSNLDIYLDMYNEYLSFLSKYDNL